MWVRCAKAGGVICVGGDEDLDEDDRWVGGRKEDHS